MRPSTAAPLAAPDCRVVADRIPQSLLRDPVVTGDTSSPTTPGTWICYLAGKSAQDGRSTFQMEIAFIGRGPRDTQLDDEQLDSSLRGRLPSLFTMYCDNPTPVNGAARHTLHCSNDHYADPALSVSYATVDHHIAVQVGMTMKLVGSTVDQVRDYADRLVRAALDAALTAAAR